MKTIFEYDEATGMITDVNGMAVTAFGMKGFDVEKEKSPVLDLIKQGVSPDDIIKMKNNDLL